MKTPLTIDHLKEKGFDLIPFREPSQSCGIDLFYGWDYAIKKIGNKTHLELRVRNVVIKVDGFYSSVVETLEELNFLIDILAGKMKQKEIIEKLKEGNKMRFTEVLKNEQLRGRLIDIVDYTHQWDEYDPVCPKEDELKIEKHKQRLNLLLDEIEEIMEHLGEINRECFGY